MTTPPSKPVEEMTEAEVRAWKDWLIEEGKRPRPFAWGRVLQTLPGQSKELTKVPVTVDCKAVSASADGTRKVWKLAVPVSESEYYYEPVLNKVIERSADGKRYIVGVRNAELQRLQELKEGGDSLPGLRPHTSR